MYKGITKIISTGIFLVALFLLSCAAIQELTKIQQPTLQVQNVRFKGMTFETLDLAFDVKINNPNPMAATLAGFDYDFLIEGASFLKGDQNQQMRIEAAGESMLEVPLTLTFNDLYKTFQALKDQDSSAYKIDLGLTFNLPILGNTRIPVSKQGTLPMVKLPAIKVGSLKLKKLSLTTADLELNLNVDNANAFSLLLNKLNYNLAINGQNWATGTTQQQLQITKKGASSIAIPVSLNLFEMGKTVYNLIAGNTNLNYRLTGDLDLKSSLPLLGQVNLPIDQAGQLNILK